MISTHQFKIMPIMSGQGQADDVHLVSESCCRQLRTMANKMCTVLSTHTNTYCNSSFAVAGTRVCKCIPQALQAHELGNKQFKGLSKSFLFH